MRLGPITSELIRQANAAGGALVRRIRGKTARRGDVIALSAFRDVRLDVDRFVR